MPVALSLNAAESRVVAYASPTELKVENRTPGGLRPTSLAVPAGGSTEEPARR